MAIVNGFHKKVVEINDFTLSSVLAKYILESGYFEVWVNGERVKDSYTGLTKELTQYDYVTVNQKMIGD